MGWFRKDSARDALAVTMAGVKLGDRFLSLGVRDAPLIAALATRAGLTGRACVVDPDAARAAAGAAAVHEQGAFVEAEPAPWDRLPFDGASFDIAVARDLLASLEHEHRTRAAAEVLRVLRGGGRFVVIESTKRTRIAPDAMTSPLILAGFAAVRVLAHADHTIFVEGIKKA
ncbi:MAG TPA: methyltransferase domain-containing protein [Vicinamibacterales bacterium]|jgi:ubiquinone/menaquinone biosynthesis C-methylase UbiE